MKFILKKDLPWIKAGTIYDSEDKVRLSKEASSINHAVMLFWTDNDFFEEVKENKVWKPERWEKYWYITLGWMKEFLYWSDIWFEKNTFSYWNVYKTEEEATKARDKQLAIVRCRNYLIENDFLYDGSGHSIVLYNWELSILDVAFVTGYWPYWQIDSRKNAEKFIKDCKEDLLTIHSV